MFNLSCFVERGENRALRILSPHSENLHLLISPIKLCYWKQVHPAAGYWMLKGGGHFGPVFPGSHRPTPVPAPTHYAFAIVLFHYLTCAWSSGTVIQWVGETLRTHPLYQSQHGWILLTDSVDWKLCQWIWNVCSSCGHTTNPVQGTDVQYWH